MLRFRGEFGLSFGIVRDFCQCHSSTVSLVLESDLQLKRDFEYIGGLAGNTGGIVQALHE